MSRRQTFTRSPSSIKRRSLLNHNLSTTTSSSCSGRFAEVAGGTAAECAAVCCCCPCGLVNFLILTVYKVPAGLCRRAWRRKKRQAMMKKGMLAGGTKGCECGCDDSELQILHSLGCDFGRVADALSSGVNNNNNNNNVKVNDFEDEEEVQKMVNFEQEMWESFYSTGFWRSPSQREPITTSSMPSLVVTN